MTTQPLSLATSSQRSPLYKLLIVVFLLTIAACSVIPHYCSGNWFLNKVPELSNTRSLRQLQTSGLPLPGWQTLEQKVVEIGGHKWSTQSMLPAAPATAATPVLLMLRPQTWHRDLPQVDWMDISGTYSWTEDRDRPLTFSISSGAASEPVQVSARFLRSWTHEQTYAVLQWYAWRDGGDSAPSQWFWAEQLSELRHRQHMSWVAVSLLMPIQPLGEIESVQSPLTDLGQLVQSRLIADILK
ncbi:MAG TPA: cyanoexosortase B system-associated protein [Coleofasciculaceae cyanobacterium]